MFALAEDGNHQSYLPQAPFSRQWLWKFAASGDGCGSLLF